MTRRLRIFAGLTRAAPLGLLGLSLGALAGAAAAGDIRSSLSEGRIARVAAAAAPQGRAPVTPQDGSELAAQLGLATREDCRTLDPAFRRGCADHVARRDQRPDPHDLPL